MPFKAYLHLMNSDLLSNPYVIILGLMILAVIVYFWSKKNNNTNRERRQRSFRDRYYEKRKDHKED